MREMIRRLLELASLFKKVHASMDALQKNEAAGLLNQVGCQFAALQRYR